MVESKETANTAHCCSRRSALTAGLALVSTAISGAALAGCSPSDGSPTAGTTGPAGTSSPTALAQATPSPSGTAAPSAQPSSPAFNQHALEQLRTRFTGITPTQWGLDIDGIKQVNSGQAVSLTLDACGGPGGGQVDRELLDFLRSEQIRATLFLNQRWIHANEALALELARDPLFEIGNHGTAHCPLTVDGRAAYGIDGTADVSAAIAEVADNHRTIFALTGAEPRWFRSGTAHYDDVGIKICQELGEIPVGFSVNADAGATFSADQVVESCSQTQPGGILIGHFNQPEGDTAEGLRRALPALREAGYRFDFLT